MDMRLFEYFLVIAREENMSKAATILHVSQPTLSRQIMQLEEELGKPLFIRGSRNLQLTNEGYIFKQRAEEMVTLGTKIKQEINSDNADLVGDIYIGAADIDDFDDFAKVIALFHKKHPKVCFHIKTYDSDQIVELVDRGVIDIGFAVEPIEKERFHYKKMTSKTRWGLLVKEDHLLAKYNTIQIEQCRNLDVIVTTRAGIVSELTNWFGEVYKTLNIVGTFNLINNAIKLAKHDMGSILCNEKSYYESLGMKFLPLDPVLYVEPILIWKKEIYSPLVQSFIQKLNYSKNE